MHSKSKKKSNKLNSKIVYWLTAIGLGALISLGASIIPNPAAHTTAFSTESGLPFISAVFHDTGLAIYMPGQFLNTLFWTLPVLAYRIIQDQILPKKEKLPIVTNLILKFIALIGIAFCALGLISIVLLLSHYITGLNEHFPTTYIWSTS